MADPRIAFLITTDPDHEGGFQKMPNDHANWSSGKIGEGTLVGTKYGITALDMPPGTDIENLTQEQAVEFYIERYWKPLYSQVKDQSVANKLADLGVLFGVGTAVGILQLTLDVKVDHAFGPATLAAVNEAEPTSLLKSFKGNFATHAFNVANANEAERGNLAGWLRRINS
jgi:lysozyme family protein